MNTSLNTLGASNLSQKQRSNRDFYATDPKTINALLEIETFSNNVWEPAAGTGNITKALEKFGYTVRSTDIVKYEDNSGYKAEELDFLQNRSKENSFEGDIITNPPYSLAKDFVLKALSLITPGHKVCMLLRLQFLEGQDRYAQLFSQGRLQKVYVFTNRQVCSATNDFTVGSAIAFAWFIWEKDYTGVPVIKWLSTK